MIYSKFYRILFLLFLIYFEKNEGVKKDEPKSFKEVLTKPPPSTEGREVENSDGEITNLQPNTITSNKQRNPIITNNSESKPKTREFGQSSTQDKKPLENKGKYLPPNNRSSKLKEEKVTNVSSNQNIKIKGKNSGNTGSGPYVPPHLRNKNAAKEQKWVPINKNENISDKLSNTEEINLEGSSIDEESRNIFLSKQKDVLPVIQHDYATAQAIHTRCIFSINSKDSEDYRKIFKNNPASQIYKTPNNPFDNLHSIVEQIAKESNTNPHHIHAQQNVYGNFVHLQQHSGPYLSSQVSLPEVHNNQHHTQKMMDVPGRKLN
uniref:Uncharacterized protein n=1 Tax=Meloidogyne hapla TaxID=6305 RepID=A0A1I8BBS0_MELHA